MFHSTTIFTLAHLLPLSPAHLPQQKTPFKVAILYNKSIADAHPSFLLEEAILLCHGMHACEITPHKINPFVLRMIPTVSNCCGQTTIIKQDCFLQEEARVCVSNAFVLEDSMFK